MTIFLSTALPAQSDTDKTQLTLKPKLCVLTEKEKMCSDQLKIHWSTGAVQSLCLYRSDQKKYLKCWQKQNQGAYDYLIHTKDSITFDLRKTDESIPLVSTTFQVIRDQKKYRRKRRNPWSFF